MSVNVEQSLKNTHVDANENDRERQFTRLVVEEYAGGDRSKGYKEVHEFTRLKYIRP